MTANTAVERALHQLLGLAKRAGKVVAGTGMVRTSARSGEVRLVVIAADAAPTQAAKLLPLLEAAKIPHATLWTRAQLGAAIGRAPVAALGLTDEGFAGRAGQLIDALGLERENEEDKA